MKQGDDVLRLNAALDGELDVEGSVEFQTRLTGDQQLQSAWASQRMLRRAIREEATYFEIPAPLRSRITQTIGAQAQAITSPGSADRGATAALANEGRRRWAMVAASALLGAALSTGVTWRIVEHGTSSSGGEQRIAEDAVAGHIRAIMTDRLVDVANSDQHTVKPWLTARLPYAPSVPDLSAHGFELVGARRDVIDGQVVAVLVYRRRQHTISAFVGPAATDGVSGQSIHHQSVRGFNVMGLNRGTTSYWIVSDLNPRDLGDFAELLAAGG